MPEVFVYVDPANGDDGQDGSVDAPLKTLREALKQATAGYGIRLFPGTYSQTTNGESWSYEVPKGVFIEAVSTKVAFENDSANEVDGLLVSGDLNVESVLFKGFAVALTADSGSVKLKAVDFVDSDVFVRGAAKVDMVQGCGFQGASQLRAAGVSEVMVSDFAPKALADTRSFVACDEGAIVTLKSATFTQPATGTWMFASKASSQLTLDGIAIAGPKMAEEASGDERLIYATDKSVVSLNSVTFTLGEANTDPDLFDDSLVFADSEANVTVTGSTLQGGGYALKLRGGAQFTGDGVFATKAQTCFELEGGSIVLKNSELKECETGIFAADVALTLEMRGTKIINHSNYGVWLNPGVGAQWTIDMGTTQEAGANTLQGSGTNLLVEGGQTGLVVEARGNIWDPNEQGAGSDGKYNPTEVMAGMGISGKNYSLFGLATLRL